ncbi:MAG: dihydrodipicolinate synthase family protein [Candidatus Thorarchaeota archaeon]
MDYEKFKEILSGYSVTTATPFSEDFAEVDVVAIASNIEFLTKNQVPLIIPNGNTGEFYSLSEEEWSTVLQAAVDATSGNSTIMSGVGHSIKTAVSQINKARNLSVSAVMVMYPQHVFSSEEGLLEYYRSILKAAKGVSVVLYKKGPLLSDDMLEKLIKYENMVGVKYAFGRIVDFARTVQRLGDKIVWSCGTAERFAPFFWLAGARAFTSGLCNFAPHISKRMFEALKKNDFASAMEVQRMITPLEDLREGRGVANNVPIIKAAMDHVGLKGGLCRPPIHPLSTEEKKATVSVISDW